MAVGSSNQRVRRRAGHFIAAALACLLPAGLIAAQVVVATTGPSDDETPQPASGFSIRKEDSKIIDSLDDFNRYRDKQAWEVAFRTLSGVTDQNPTGMVPAAEPGRQGFFISTRQRVWKALVSLPPAGKEAYRLFNDAKARQLLEQAKSDLAVGRDDTPSLKKIFDQYFVTSVGGEAADRLGDAAFEAGDFARAASLWGAILQYDQDSSIPRVRLQVKQAVALAREKRWPQFHELLQRVRDDGTGQTVMLGGRKVVAADYLASLEQTDRAIEAPPSPPEMSQAQTTAVGLPAQDSPAWQMKFMGDDLADKISAALTSMGWGAGNSALSVWSVPACACDGQRVYVNWLGVCFALDAENGKLLWRTQKFADLGDHVTEFVQNGMNPDRFTLQLAGPNLLAIDLNPDRQNDATRFFQLACLDAATGRQRWSSTKVAELANWEFFGKPLVVQDVIYALAETRNSQDCHLLALSLESGKMQWDAPLGTSQTGRDMRGMAVNLLPLLLYRQGTLYILTNDGALLGVDVSGRRLDWAFKYDGPPVEGQQTFFMMAAQADQVVMPGALLLRGATLYLKESRAAAMYALDLGGADGPAVEWRRPASDSDTIAYADEKNIYLLGTELSAIDRQTRSMKWSTRLPTGRPTLPIVSGRSLFGFVGRGVYQVALDSGDVVGIFRGADRDSVGGALLADGRRLICVSNLAVTAYPVPAAKAGQTHRE